VLEVLISPPVKAEHRAALERAAEGRNARLTFLEGERPTDSQLEQVHVVIGNQDPERIAKAKNLRWLQLFSAGADGFIQPGVLRPGAILTNATGGYGLAISEHMMGMLLMLMKNLHLYRDNQRKTLWRDEGPVTSLEGATVLVVGLGDIGGEFAKRLRPFGAVIWGVKRRPSAKPEYVDRLALTEQLDELLPQADVVALALPGTAETAGMFSRRRLSLMKRGAFLLNVGRGSAVDQDALAELLENGHLGGAGLDVTDPEPLPAEHPLWKAKNALITPHVSGGFHLPQTLDRIVGIAARNLSHFLHGEEMENVVDFATGYKK